MSLSVRVGDRYITRLAEDLVFSRGLHGDAACTVQLRDRLSRRDYPEFERIYVSDHRAETQYEGRLEDPGRSVDGDGQVLSMAAVGELARAADETAALIYIDNDLSRWIRELLSRAPSANGDVSEIPENANQADGLLMQFNPGEPVDSSSAIVMAYRAIEEAGMLVGGIEYTIVAGFSPAAGQYESRMLAVTGAVGTLLRQDNWSVTPVSRGSTIGTDTPAGTTAIHLSAKRTGAATNVGGDNVWAGFYNIIVKAARYKLDGTLDTAHASYQTGRKVFAHEVVIDVLARLLSTVYDVANASIDTSSTYPIDQLAYPDGVTPEQLFADLMEMLPDYYWQVGHVNPATGKPSVAWRKWPTNVRYEFSLRDGLDLPGNDAELANKVVVRWKDKRGRIRVSTYHADGVFAPTVPALDNAGLTRAGYVDLSDEVGSQANADKAAAEYLAEHASPPVAGTLTVARRVWDYDLGRAVEPYEIMPGYLGRIRELGDSAVDLASTDRDGKSVFRIVGMEYTRSSNLARVELDAPPKTDEATLAELVRQRTRKR